MKRILSFFVLASVLLASSCSLKEDFKGNDSEFATISLTLGGPESSATRAIGDGLSVDLLHYAVYDSNNELIPALGKVVEVNKFPTQVDITLAKGQTYKIAFWAQNQSTRAYTINNGDVRHVAINYAGYNNNDESRDAFFKTIEHTVTGDIALDVVLERPFAQINLGVTAEDWAAAETAGISVEKSMVKISNAASALDLFNGQVGAGTEVVYGFAEIPALSGEILTVEEVAYKYLSMNYILVNSQDVTAPAQGLYGEGKELVNAEFTLKMADTQDQDVVVKVDNLPVQRNWRTNVIGRMLTGDISFTISLDPIFDGEENYPDSLEEELYFAALNGGEVALTSDIVLTYPMNVNGDMVLNMGNHTLIGSILVAEGANLVVNEGTIVNTNATVSGIESHGDLTLNKVNIRSARHAVRIEKGNVVIDGGEYTIIPQQGKTQHALNVSGNSNVVVKDGKFVGPKGTNNDSGSAVNVQKGATVTIEGGDFSKGKNKTLANAGTLKVQGGTFDQDPSKYVVAGYKSILDGDKYIVKSDTYVTTAEELAAALKSDAAEINVVLYNDIDVAISSLGQITGGSGEYKLGGENTQKINIDLNGKKLNITTTYWSGIGAKNDNALFTIKNGTMTSSQATGTWNSYDLTFANCNYDIQDVVFEKAIAFTNAGKTASLQNVTINETHDYYAMWVSAKGQALNIDGLTINSLGRGIKIDEQYVDAPAKVVMNISNAEFKTAKKAAILVKSVAGAEINASNLDITNVAADKVNAVWVDADAAAYYEKVIVDGCSMIIEDCAQVASQDDFAAAMIAGESYIVLANGNYTLPGASNKNITIIGSSDAVVTINKPNMGGSNITFDGVTVKGSGYATGVQHVNTVTYKNVTVIGEMCLYGENASFTNCTFELTNQYIWVYGCKVASFDKCTFNTNGKAILVYNEGAGANDVTVRNCTFNATAGAKAGAIANQNCAAIEIDNFQSSGVGVAHKVTTSNNIVGGNFSGEWRIKNYVSGAPINVNGVDYTSLAIDGKLMTIDGDKNVTVK